MDETKKQDLIEFPCHYQFKAVGDGGKEFKQGIVNSVNKIVEVSTDSVKSRPSGKGTYQSISIYVTLYNYKQLTDIYAEMKKVPGLKMLL
jgi:uncharacterized protein